MLSTLFIAGLAAVGLSSAAKIEARDGLSSSQILGFALGGGPAYHVIGEKVRMAGPNGKGGAAVISAYNALLSGAGPFPPPGGQKAFPEATQFAICSGETTSILEILETITLFKLNVEAFNPSQKSKILKLLKHDLELDKAFVPVFAQYVPACADAVYANGNATVEAYKSAIQIYAS